MPAPTGCVGSHPLQPLTEGQALLCQVCVRRAGKAANPVTATLLSWEPSAAQVRGDETRALGAGRPGPSGAAAGLAAQTAFPPPAVPINGSRGCATDNRGLPPVPSPFAAFCGNIAEQPQAWRFSVVFYRNPRTQRVLCMGPGVFDNEERGLAGGHRSPVPAG